MQEACRMIFVVWGYLNKGMSTGTGGRGAGHSNGMNEGHFDCNQPFLLSLVVYMLPQKKGVFS